MVLKSWQTVHTSIHKQRQTHTCTSRAKDYGNVNPINIKQEKQQQAQHQQWQQLSLHGKANWHQWDRGKQQLRGVCQDWGWFLREGAWHVPYDLWQNGIAILTFVVFFFFVLSWLLAILLIWLRTATMSQGPLDQCG